jgi:very-short-patch-repair endonuclease
MEPSTVDDQLEQDLERVRSRLLDLSSRNPLLNYSHPPAKSLRIVDEVPTLVLERLLSDGAFRFSALQGPDTPLTKARGRSKARTAVGRKVSAGALSDEQPATESDESTLQSQSNLERRAARRAARAEAEERTGALAKQLGVNPSYDLPAVTSSTAKAHADRRLQTLLPPDELEGRLQKLRATALTGIQESGANMLHLLFGFVEWTDVPGGRARLAPLVLLPVTLSRLELDDATHTYPYTIEASGEDWNTNVTLQEKCRKDFGFVLPNIEPEENLEGYFARVQAVLKSASAGWRVRRQLTLGLVSFGKILMWRDLDPATWPEESPLLGGSLLRQVIGRVEDENAQEDGAGTGGAAEYNIDKLGPECGPVPPIVVPADSSQHSVLVDVQRGRNLVVQGPPGTGKSQTITNIIAAAIASQKKVLFVAEKKAALEVVARRLADAGLGAFCLPLHSHTSNKREFLDGLKARIALSSLGNSDRDMAVIEARLSETRTELTGHAERLHAPFGALGDTPFVIFWRARRLGAELPEQATIALRSAAIPDAAALSPRQVAQHRDAMVAFAAAYSAAELDRRPGDTHPWDGLSHADLNFDDSEALLALAQRVRTALSDAKEAQQALQATMGGVKWPDTPAALVSLLTRCSELRAPGGAVPSGLIEAIQSRTGIKAVQAAIEATEVACRAWSNVAGPWGTPGAVSKPAATEFAERTEQAITTFGAGCTVAQVSTWIVSLRTAAAQLSDAETLGNALGVELGIREPLTLGSAFRLIEVALAAEQLPAGALELRSPALLTPNAVERITTLAARAAALIAGEDQNARFVHDARPSLAALREMGAALADAPRFLPTLLSGAYRRAVARYRQMGGSPGADRRTMMADVEALSLHVAAYDAFVNDPVLPLLFGASMDGVRSPFREAMAVVQWAQGAALKFRGTGELGRVLLETTRSGSPFAWSEAGARALSNPAAVASAAGLDAILQGMAGIAADHLGGWDAIPFAMARGRLEHSLTVARHGSGAAQSAALNDTQPLSDIQKLLAELRHAWAADLALFTHTETFEKLGMSLPPAATVGQSDVLTQLREALKYLHQLEEPEFTPDMIGWLAAGEQAPKVAALREKVTALRAKVMKAAAAEDEFVSAGAVDPTRWYGGSPSGVGLATRIARFDRAIGAAAALPRYVTLLRSKASVLAGPMPSSCTLLESGAIDARQLPATYDYLLARSLAAVVLREHPKLERFSGDLHERRRHEFAALDEQFIKLTQQVVAQRASTVPRIPGNRNGPVKDLSEQSLIEHEIDKTRRHIPIREMFKRAGNSIQSLKPCVMMGPQAVAQYLPPGHLHFDLVVMDEASQMRPEDALGAIARGSQLVVVGDPRQLGPSSFFASQSSDDDELDEVEAVLAADAKGMEGPRGALVIERSESILLAAARSYPLRMLRWHYRSRYPQLIAFSNQEFYNNELVLFPHPGCESLEDGLNFRPVDKAVYSAGTNIVEAEAIVKAVCEHAAESPQRSLLVVTMNQAQRELVDALVQGVEKDDLALAAFRARHESTLEPFAVKNLENVQGDERDNIYVSVTYGPNDRGTVSQNFGPINTVGGERRLNVLFTRAKFRIDVFCSFDPTTLRVSDSSPRGLCVLRDYLRFAQEKKLATGRFTAREPDSDFEIDVARALRAHGLEVHPQVGVAGYFLDLAVVDPNRPGRYILAVECDGATYHSAKSARDRDRLRQGILEGLGWNVHRIWSTDWFRDPRTETIKTVRRVEQLLAQKSSAPIPGRANTVVTA